MEDLIRRSDAIKAVEECLKLLARPRYTVKTAIEAIPSVDIPHSDEWDKYSDKLWKNAYERGKADRPQEWIPCSERLPKSHGYYICTCKDGSKYKRTTVVKWSNGVATNRNKKLLDSACMDATTRAVERSRR